MERQPGQDDEAGLEDEELEEEEDDEEETVEGIDEYVEPGSRRTADGALIFDLDAIEYGDEQEDDDSDSDDSDDDSDEDDEDGGEDDEDAATGSPAGTVP